MGPWTRLLSVFSFVFLFMAVAAVPCLAAEGGGSAPAAAPATQAAHGAVELLGPTFTQTSWWQWGTLAGLIFAGLLAGRIAQAVLRKAAARLKARHWHIRGTVFDNLASPLSLTLLTLGITVGVSVIHTEGMMTLFVTRALAFLYILAVGWFLYNLVEVFEVMLRRMTTRTASKLDDMMVPLIRKTLRIFLVIVFTLVVAQNVFGMNIAGWLAGLGIAGLAVSLAAQDSVKNFFGSLTVFFDKPFIIGDYINFNGDAGTVEEIGFRSTRIRLLSGALVTVPNMQFIDNKCENISARPSIRHEMFVPIVHDTPPAKIEEAVRIVKAILHEPEVVESGCFDMDGNPPRVNLLDMDTGRLNLKVYYWYQLTGDSSRGWYSYLDHRELVNLKIMRAFAKAGIEFAYPTQTMHIAGDRRRQLAVRLGGDGDGDSRLALGAEDPSEANGNGHG